MSEGTSWLRGLGGRGQNVGGRWGYSFRPTSGKREAPGLADAGRHFAARLGESRPRKYR